MDLHQHCVATTVTREPADALGRPGPFVKVTRLFDNENVVVDWYTIAEALRFADELRRAAA